MSRSAAAARIPYLLLFMTTVACASSDAQDPTTSGELPKGLVTFMTAEHDVNVQVEIAADAESRRVGLMHRESLGETDGMVFVFPEEKVQSFWMQNTLIPLDMIFLSAERVVLGLIENAEPLTTTSRSIGVPSKYVVEVNVGFARQQGIAAGTRAEFTDVPDTKI